jgi:hypothetical protein
MGERSPKQDPTEIAYWRTLQGQDPAALCRRTLATLDPSEAAYELRVAGLAYRIAPKTRTIIPKLAIGPGDVEWDTRLLILAYLTGATETRLAGKWVSPIRFSGGDLFFSSDAHNLRFKELLLTFKSPEDFLRAGEKIGGVRHNTGDSSFTLQTLPRVPILFIYWQGDEEVPSKISVLVDESARSHLAIDALWLAIRVSEKRLLKVAKSNRDSSAPMRKV